MKFKCATCGREHDIEDISFGSARPAQWELLSDAERKESELSDELCVITFNGELAYFQNACLEVPIRGTDRAFTWGVWVSLSKKSFGEVVDHWKDPDRTLLGPYFGWLCTRIPGYPDTMHLKTMVHNRKVGIKPRVELEPTEHPLSQHQQQGISPEDLRRIVESLLHTKS
jgi:hypothetical protein